MQKIESCFVFLRRRMIERSHTRQRQGGFTLVELMVVVAIIAILTTVAMPQFMTAGDKAKVAKEKADKQIISNAAQLYIIDKGDTTVPTIDNLYAEGYLAEKVTPPNGGQYVISYTATESDTSKRISVTTTAES